MNKRLAGLGFAGIVAAMSLSACQQKAAERAPLEGATIGGSFTLTDQDGKPFSSDSLKGKYRILYFGYTFCPDACPLDVTAMMKGFERFDKAHPGLADQVQPRRVNPHLHQVCAHRKRPPLGQRRVIVGRSDRIGMPLDPDLDVRRFLHHLCHDIDHRVRRVRQHRRLARSPADRAEG